MREILFRGKRKDNNKWVYGFFNGQNILEYRDATSLRIVTIVDKNTRAIISSYPVIPETVGQYTGLKDKNGKRIFEGDVIRDNSGNCVGVIKFGKYGMYDDYGFYIDWGEAPDPASNLRNDLPHWVEYVASEVIGNIHDNPELLEVE